MLSEQLNRFSFNPDINPTSKRLASNSRERTSPLAVSKAKYQAQEMSFQPKINDESRRIVEQTFYEN